VKKFRFFLLVVAVSISVLLLINLYFVSIEIQELQSYKSLMQDKYDRVSDTQKKLKELNSAHLKAPFFDKADYLEKYLRDLVQSNRIQILSIKGQFIDKDFSEVEIHFSSNAEDFFRFLSSIENADKLLNIKRVSVKRGKGFLLDGNMSVVGYNE